MTRLELYPASAMLESPSVDLLALNEALARLEQQWPDKAKPEASMRISTTTAGRHWRFAGASLYGQLRNEEPTSKFPEGNERLDGVPIEFGTELVLEIIAAGIV